MKKLLKLLKIIKFSLLTKNRGGLILPLFVLFLLFTSCGINVPYTVVVRNWAPSSFKLTPEEREKLRQQRQQQQGAENSQ